MSQELRAAVLATLRADATLVAAKVPVWDTAPRGTKFPYIELGDDFVSDDSYDSGDDRVDGFETQLGVHCWAREADAPRARTLAAAVRKALNENEAIAVAGHRLGSIHHVTTRSIPDPDANVEHVVVMFEVLTETT